MALTAVKIQELEDKGFDVLYTQHSALWLAKAREAYDYTKGIVTAAGQNVRPDDVIGVLVPALELSDEFRSFLEEKRVRQKYWRTWFAEYILDQIWQRLSVEEGQDDQANGDA